VRTSRLTLLAAALAALAVAPSAGARSSLKVCSLISAKQVATIVGLSSRCSQAAPLPGPGSTIYTGNWAGKTPRSPQLQVAVSVYGDKGALKMARLNLGQGLVGASKKVKGIGSAAYGATGAAAAEIRFVVGKDIVALILTTVGKQPRVTPALTALAKAIATRL
jgi:hypothetical protein